MSTVVLSGGGTAGHVLPALALLPELKKYFDRIIFIGGDGIEKGLVETYGLPFYRVETAGLLRGRFFENLKIPACLIKGINQAKKILQAEKPAAVFSKGGFASLPAVIAAKKLGIPVFAHESDLSVGLANKIAVKTGATLLTAFPETAEANSGSVFTGFPIREELYRGSAENAKRALKITSDKPVLLAVGGSSGSTALNEAVISALPELTKNFTVVHITGGKCFPPPDLKNYRALDYCSYMADLYALAEVVVSRSGAGAVSELSALKKRAVLIPLPAGASRGDQLQNADYAGRQGAVVLTQDKLNPTTLLDAVKRALRSPMRPFAENANKKIADIIAAAAKA